MADAGSAAKATSVASKTIAISILNRPLVVSLM
jgi:hypothetical protein